jgi:predicted nucleotide-binding protein
MEPKEENGKEDVKERRSPRPFPKHTLQEALEIPVAIQEKNAGRPMKRILLADAVGRKPTSSEFKNLLSSSFKYGLTEGTEKAEYISLTQLGLAITKPKDDKEFQESKVKAALIPDIFKKIYIYYKDAKLPSDAFLKNILEREFNIDREWVDDCIAALVANAKYVNILIDVSGSPYITFDSEKTQTVASTDNGKDQSVPPKKDDFKQDTEDIKQPAEAARAPTEVSKLIFIAHGKNKKPVEQLKGLLDQFHVPFVIAEEEPHSGRPISIKVAQSMQSCSSAIFVFTSDEEYTTPTGDKVFKPSDNVVYELGAASVLYGKKIVIFKEDGVEFASDFKDLGYISFEKDKLNAKAMDLLRELIGHGFLKVVAG